jgi:tetratricopeptide (TPR) repeat protein
VPGTAAPLPFASTANATGAQPMNAWAASSATAPPVVSTQAPTGIAPHAGLDRNRMIGLALALSGLFVLAVILALATRTTGPTSPTTGASITPPDPRPLDQRMFAYQQQPDVAQAIARMYAGDTNAAVAPLQARLRTNPQDGLAAYFLGTVYRAGRRLGPAMEQFATALRVEPALAEDSTLATAAVEALADPSAARAAEALFRGPLSQSHTAARAVADEAIHGSSSAARAGALDIADSMQPLLTPLDRARIRLRIARNCDELRAALGGLESMGEGTPRDEAEAVREGACDMLRMGHRCDECREGHGRRH